MQRNKQRNLNSRSYRLYSRTIGLGTKMYKFNSYKILDQIGKVTAVRHPLLIEVEYLVTSENQTPINGLGYYEGL